jgi:hypothetical protein
MKVKSILFMGLVALSLVSCDAIKDATSVDVKTSLGVDIPVTSNEQLSVVLKSTSLETNSIYSFSGESEFSLSENPDLSKYVENITGIEINKGSIIFPGFVAGNMINTFTVSIENETGVEILSLTKDNITESKYTLTDTDVSNLATLATAMENSPEGKFKFKISGTANYPINGSVEIDYGALVKASIVLI